MNYQHRNFRLFFHFAALILILAGCAGQIQKPVRLCPGAESTAESLSLLRLHSRDAVSFKANGQCLLRYHSDAKPHKENFPVKLWVNPPAEIYLQGDVAFDPKGLVLGSNEEEFWFSGRLKEIDSFFWGRWSEARGVGGLKLSPKILLEALGIIEANCQDNWSLSSENGFDILTKRNEDATIVKRVHIYNCDYRIRKIEYFDDDERLEAVVELNKYKEIHEDVSIPRVMKVFIFNDDGTEDLSRITVGSMKYKEFSDRQRERLFVRPEPKGFGHIYKIVGEDVIEQTQ